MGITRNRSQSACYDLTVLLISGVYEMHFGSNVDNITLHKWLQRDLMSATLCVWIRTRFPGLQLKYKQNTECHGKTSIKLLVEEAQLKITLHGNEWFA